MERNSTVVWNETINTPDWQEIEWVVIHTESPYNYWPEINTFKVVHRTDAYEVVLHQQQLVDEDFDEDFLLDVIEDIATKTLPPEDKH